MEHYRPLPDNLTIRPSQLAEQTNRPELGLFATRPIAAGTELGTTHYIIESPDQPIKIIRTPLGGFFNHSVDPNCEVRTDLSEPITQIRLRTIRAIEADEELTARYTMYNPTTTISNKAIPTLEGDEAEEFVRKADENVKAMQERLKQKWEEVQKDKQNEVDYQKMFANCKLPTADMDIGLFEALKKALNQNKDD